jgi:hypothetical protein
MDRDETWKGKRAFREVSGLWDGPGIKSPNPAKTRGMNEALWVIVIAGPVAFVRSGILRYQTTGRDVKQIFGDRIGFQDLKDCVHMLPQGLIPLFWYVN